MYIIIKLIIKFYYLINESSHAVFCDIPTIYVFNRDQRTGAKMPSATDAFRAFEDVYNAERLIDLNISLISFIGVKLTWSENRK